MATVYLADDLKHERKVALKVLKPELAALVGAERFLAEIKTTANLQHPHILPLFDSGEADGFLFYVMPYVEGETLRERIDSEKQLPVDEAVRIAAAVANALDHAHRQDVIHRDIKPANILLQDGEPVVADFGIALALGAAGGNRLTETGLSLGTPYYMSPEQATSDQEVGPASDTYALACVLYEMLVGEPPFSASSARAVLVKILTTDAPSVTTARKTVPPHVDRVLARALQKLPADRFATAAQFAEALTNPAFTAPTTPPPEAVPERARPWPRRSLANWQLAVGFGVAVALGAMVGILSDGAEPAGPVTRFTLDVVLEAVNRGSAVELSRDGSQLVYVGVGEEGESRLYRRRLADVDAVPIAGTEGSNIQMPFFSPDGELIGFQGNQEFRTVAVGGGSPRVVTRVSPVLNGATWAPGDLIVYNAGAGTGLMVVSAEGGEPRPLTSVDSAAGEFDHRWPHALPDGRSVVFTIWNGSLPTARLGVASLETGEVRDLGIPGTNPQYVDTGYLVYASPEGALRAVAFDMGAGELAGDPATVINSVPVVSGTGAASFAISLNGTLAFVSSETNMVPVLVDSVGSATRLPQLEPGAYQSPRFSPDGSAFAVENGDEIWVYDFALGTFSPLTLGGGFYPLWTPDGERLLFSRNEGADVNVYSTRTDRGEGEVPVLRISGQQNRTQDLSPDGRHVILRRNSGAQTYDLYALALDSARTVEPWLITPALERAPTFSPGSDWIAYSSDESGRDEVYVRPFPGPGGRIPVTTRGGTEPAWDPDGGRLIYRSGNRFEVVEVETDPTFRVLSPPSTLFEGRFYAYSWSRQYDVHPDGDQFLLFQYESERSEVTVVVGFIEELKERVGN